MPVIAGSSPTRLTGVLGFLGLVCVPVLMGCGERQLSRSQLEDRYVDDIVDAGVERSVAECVVDRLFSAMSDDELREFNTTGTELTAEQSVRVGELADACGA